jgi:DnaJ-class molecular chaperone
MKYKELAKKYHPDRKGGNAEKVNFFTYSSKNYQKLMSVSQIQTKEKCMINMDPKEHKPEEEDTMV